jgi:hypothetical protein
MNRTLLTLAASLVAATATVTAQTAADSAGIRQTALDYIEGWYSGDATRMERALHPELAKRQVYTDQGGRSRLIQMSAMTLVQSTRAGGGKETPQAERKTDVTILDIYQQAAVARVDAGGWVDYMHLARWNGQWKIVNVLWENAPPRR